jgi:hypothetical protein
MQRMILANREYKEINISIKVKAVIILAFNGHELGSDTLPVH